MKSAEEIAVLKAREVGIFEGRPLAYFLDGWDKGIEYAAQDRWVKVSERLPEFDVNVLVYWKLEKSKTNGGGYYDMIEIASISSISHGKDWQSVEWRDSEYNSVNPTHWMELPTPPKD